MSRPPATARRTAEVAGSSRSEARRALERLRVRLLVAFGVVALLAIAAFATVLIDLELDMNRARLDADLKGVASRAAALMYVDDTGTPQVEAVDDDTVTHGDLRIIITTDDEAHRVLLDSAPRPDRAVLDGTGLWDLVSRSLQDGEERGVHGHLDVPEGELHAAAMPWWDDKGIAGVAVATEKEAKVHDSELLRPTVLGSASLLALLLLMVWWITSRSLCPAIRADEERERFLASAAHELRTPLTRMRTGAEELARAHDPGSPQAEEARRLIQDVDEAASVVSNLLLVARIDRSAVVPTMSRVRLDELASDLEMRHPALVADVREPIAVRGDPALIRHAVENLIDNALRHGGAGLPDPVLLEVDRDGAMATLTVRDHGPGFPPGTQLGRPYMTTGGTGLGLFVVRWVTERHRGRLELVESSRGAAIRMSLPIDDPAPDEMAVT